MGYDNWLSQCSLLRSLNVILIFLYLLFPSPCVSPMMTRMARRTASSAMPQSCLQLSSNHQGLLVLIKIQSGWEKEAPDWEDTCSTGRRDKNSGSTLMLLWQKQILQMDIEAIPLLDRQAKGFFCIIYYCTHCTSSSTKNSEVSVATIFRCQTN